MFIKKFDFLLFSIATLTTFSLCANDLSTEKRIDLLEKKIKIMSTKSKPQPLLDTMKFAGLVQMDFNQFNGVFNAKNRGKSGSDVFTRRVHFRVFHKSSEELDYVMLFFANDDDTNLLVGFARYQFDTDTEIRVGKLKEDRSLSVQYIGEEVTAERPMLANAFAVGFHWGAQGHKTFNNGLRFAAGVFEDKKYAGNKDGRNDNNDLELAYNSRITWSKVLQNDVIHIGGSASYRDLGDESFQLSEVGGIKSASNSIVQSSLLSSAKKATILMGEFAWQKSAFRIEGEYGSMDVDSNLSSDISLSGYYLSVNYFLDGKTYSNYNSKYAKFGRPSNESNTFAIYARHSALDLIDNNEGSRASVSMIGTTYFYNKNLSFQLQYSKANVSGPAIDSQPFKLDSNVLDSGDAFSARIGYRF